MLMLVPKSLSRGADTREARRRFRLSNISALTYFTLHRSRSCDQHCGHWRRASDRGKQSIAGFGRSWSDPDKGSLATVGEGSGSDRNKRSLEISALLHAHKSETAFAGSGSSPPRPASHSKGVARETSTVPFSFCCLNHFTDGLSSSDSEQAPNSLCWQPKGPWAALHCQRVLIGVVIRPSMHSRRQECLVNFLRVSQNESMPVAMGQWLVQQGPTQPNAKLLAQTFLGRRMTAVVRGTVVPEC